MTQFNIIDLAIKDVQLSLKDAKIRLQLLLHEINIFEGIVKTLEVIKNK